MHLSKYSLCLSYYSSRINFTSRILHHCLNQIYTFIYVLYFNSVNYLQSGENTVADRSAWRSIISSDTTNLEHLSTEESTQWCNVWGFQAFVIAFVSWTLIFISNISLFYFYV